MAQAVPVVGDGEPAGLLGECFLALQGLELVFFGDLGGDHLEHPVREPAQRDRVVLGRATDQVGLGVAAVLDRQRVDTLHDHHGLLLGHLAGGHRVRTGSWSWSRACASSRRRFASRLVCRVGVGPVAAGVRGAGLSAEVETVGVVGVAELELGDLVPQLRPGRSGWSRSRRPGRVHSPRSAMSCSSWVTAAIVDVDRVLSGVVECRCHTGNSGIRHRHSRSENAGISGTGGEVFRKFLERRCRWSRQARPAGADQVRPTTALRHPGSGPHPRAVPLPVAASLHHRQRVPNRGLNHRTPKTWCAPPTPALTLDHRDRIVTGG